jgi:DNA polymerase-3 subunit alpha
MAGVVAAVRTQMTRRGKMAFVTLDDGQAQVDVAVFNEAFDANRQRIKEDALLVIAGKASHDDYSGGMRVTADEILDLEGARTRFATQIRVLLNDDPDAYRLMEVLAPYRDSTGCPVSLTYRNDMASCDLTLGPGWKVRLAEELLEALAGFGEVRTAYSVVLKSGRERGERESTRAGIKAVA